MKPFNLNQNKVLFVGILIFATTTAFLLYQSQKMLFARQKSRRISAEPDEAGRIRRHDPRSTLPSFQVSKGNHQKGFSYKLVLLYTPIFGRLPWKGLNNSHDFTHWENTPCPVSNCQISYDKKDLSRSDAVVFHGRDMPGVREMKRISRHRPSRQKWVYFMQENPHFTFYDPAIYNGFFNWTMTYRRDSEIFVPYNYYTPIQPEDFPTDADRNYASKKDKFIAWMVSNCGQLREKYVRKLMEYVPVDIFGACGIRFNQTNHCHRGSEKCTTLKKRYKFYLAFENKMCVDYITEKYWYTPFKSDMVPVVLGGSNYDFSIAVPGSYVNVLDFPSVKALANYLEYLNQNDTAYNEYFQWKRRFKIKYTKPWTCQMCSDLNNSSLPTTVYNNLGEFWGIKASCFGNIGVLRKMLEATQVTNRSAGLSYPSET